MNDNYYIGLDMGTSSVGWAVTSPDYHLLRRKGKDLWGVRLFDEVDTSSARRVQRGARRRLAREKARVGYLREIFADAINDADPSFYQRLDDSKYYLEDKAEKQTNALFNDSSYKDADYYAAYPTIFHLRKELIESEEPHDVRLVYLAVLNIFKLRGHFLNMSLSDEGIGNLNDLYQELCERYTEMTGKELYAEDSTEWLESILSSKRYSRSVKHSQILEKVGITKTCDKQMSEMWKMICGLKGTLSVLFKEDTFDDDNVKYSVSFQDNNFDEKTAEIEEMLSPDSYEILLILKGIYDWSVLANIMKGEKSSYEYLSFARVDSYEKHKRDLQLLKKLYIENTPELYDDMFRTMSEGNYSAYIGSVNSKKEKTRRGAKNNSEAFFKQIKSALKDMPDSEEKEYILNEIEKGTFLPKQLTSANGVIPNQVHKRELKVILKNASNYLSFLSERDESGLTAAERLVKIFEFQIPYYIGPIAPYVGYNIDNGNVWSVRKENGPVFPWNFEDKIDTKASAEGFIQRLVNQCTYISGETVLPKNSLLYERFMVLNELNNLRINGEKPSVALKQSIYTDLFRKGKRVKKTDLIKYLCAQGVVSTKEETDISGIDGDFTNTCANYAKFTAAFGVDVLTYDQERMAEDIIYWSTIYGDTKKFLRDKIQEAYGDKLSKAFVKRITGIKFKDWGRLSKAFLNLEGADAATGEIKTIIGRMWDENKNIMELIATDNYTYIDSIKEKQASINKTLFEIKYEDLEELYISAPVRRMVWQTILILKEIVKVMGCEPKRIFVEMARSPEERKTRKDSRKKKLLELYKNCKKESTDWVGQINGKSEGDFRSKKLYLYYMQKGRCMYTNELIDLGDLFDDNKYDIDHIYPRHFVKDDSIENNLVLVKKEVNAHKTDNFPIEASIQAKCRSLWMMLREGGFITEEKYKRLTRTTEFTESEQAAFVARQIVETRQGTKVITDIFDQTFPDSTIVYSKAGNVSEFRQKYDLLKCRAVNDFHHANDAYLNIVVGNVYYTKFTNNPINFVRAYRKDPKHNSYHMGKIFEYNVARNGDTAWDVKDDKSITVVKKVMSKQTPLVTRQIREIHGGFYKQQIIGKSQIKKVNGKGYVAIKSNDLSLLNTCKYGGYKSVVGSYFFLVEHVVKGKRIRTIEEVPLLCADRLREEKNILKYCYETLGYKDVKVCLTRIPKYSLLKINGFYLYLSGRTNNQLRVASAVQMKLDKNFENYIRELVKYIDGGFTGVAGEKIDAFDITKKRNEELYEVLAEKHSSGIFSKRPNPMGTKLVDGKEHFQKLSVEKQVSVILQVLRLSDKTNQGANLKDIGGDVSTGVSLFTKTISTAKEAKLIRRSVTGLYEQEVNLLTV